MLCFSNPIVPCDAITIPKINLYAWKEGFHLAPVHAAPLVYAPISASQPLAPINEDSDIKPLVQTPSPHDFNLEVTFCK